MAEEDTVRERAAPADAIPPVNTLVRVNLSTGPDEDHQVEASSRVEDVVTTRPGNPTGVELLVAAPRFSGDVDRPERDTPCLVTWLTQRGIHELPTVYRGSERVHDTVRVWRLRVTGPAYRVQRRRFFRVPCSFPVVLHRDTEQAPAADAERTLSGFTLDLSEGGARCAVNGPALESGARVRLSLAIDGELLEAPAVVIRAEQGGAGQPDRYELALCFEASDAYSDALRRIVFAEQLRSRRLAGG